MVLVLPVKFSFYDESSNEAWDLFDQIVDLLFFFDMIFTFFTPIVMDDKMVTSLWKIAKSYLKFWFWLDLLSIFPFEYIISKGQLVSLVRLSRIPRLYRLVKITKLIRSIRASRNENNILSKINSLIQMNASNNNIMRKI